MRINNLLDNQMNAAEHYCSNPHCPKVGLKGQANIRIHSNAEHRLRCSECKRTFVATTGTPFFGLKTADWEVRVVIILLAWGCPIQAIVQAFELDERTVAVWRDKAGKHCVHCSTTLRSNRSICPAILSKVIICAFISNKKPQFWAFGSIVAVVVSPPQQP